MDFLKHHVPRVSRPHANGGRQEQDRQVLEQFAARFRPYSWVPDTTLVLQSDQVALMEVHGENMIK